MKDVKVNRDFNERDYHDRSWLLQNTWCEICLKSDLGMDMPTEYEMNGKIYLSGFCTVCGSEINSEIIE